MSAIRLVRSAKIVVENAYCILNAVTAYIQIHYCSANTQFHEVSRE
jgi:hypothetical protein